MRQAACNVPDKLAVVDSNQQLTWGEWDSQINRVANALIDSGLQANDRIAILSPNCVEYLSVFAGSLRAGVCVAPLSSLASAETLAAMINDSEAKLLFVSSDYWELIAPQLNQLTRLQPNGVIILKGEQSVYPTYKDFIRDAGEQAPDLESADRLDGEFNLIYSSGTTGTPKGILHDRRYRARENQDLSAMGCFHPDTRTLISTPLYSNTTLFTVFPTLAAGGTLYLMEKFDTTRFLQLSQQHAINHTVLVPVQYARLLKAADFDQYDLSAYQIKYSTSAPLHQNTKKEILARWPAGGLVEIYGMTEGGVVCALAAHEFPDKLDTVGCPVADCDLKIIDPQGNELPQGEVGEVIGRNRKMMRGYVNRPEATAHASWYDGEGRRYHKSGDIGWLDSDGFLHLLDRKKDMIISGGFNIYAVDLENALLAQPSVQEAAVIGVPSEQWGETPVAFVVADQDQMIEPEALRTKVNASLGKAQRIAEIRLVDELPRSPIGKVLKRALRDDYAAS